jgi:type VI secretion system secreted protein VgrG
MVGFQHGDPERPFVYGSVPHGKNAAVPKPAVQEHHLSVNSGTTVTFLDTQTKHELHLQVDKENLLTIVVDSGQGTITLNASKAIALKATQEITLDAPKITLTGDNVSIKGTAKVAIAGAQIDIKADAELKEAGATVKITGTGMATLESSGMTTVKGSVVMIN